MYEREWGLCTHTFMLICTEKLFGIGVINLWFFKIISTVESCVERK